MILVNAKSSSLYLHSLATAFVDEILWWCLRHCMSSFCLLARSCMRGWHVLSAREVWLIISLLLSRCGLQSWKMRLRCYIMQLPAVYPPPRPHDWENSALSDWLMAWVIALIDWLHLGTIESRARAQGYGVPFWANMGQCDANMRQHTVN